MKVRKSVLHLVVFFVCTLNLFALNDVLLTDSAKKNGMTFYWDSLSETGTVA